MIYPNFNITIAVHVCIGSYSDSFTGVYLLVIMVSVAELPWDYLLLLITYLLPWDYLLLLITYLLHVCIGSYSDSFTGVYLLVIMVSVAELPWDYLLLLITYLLPWDYLLLLITYLLLNFHGITYYYLLLSYLLLNFHGITYYYLLLSYLLLNCHGITYCSIQIGQQVKRKPLFFDCLIIL